MSNEIIVEMASAGEIIVEISGMTYQSVSDQITALETDKADKSDTYTKVQVDSKDVLKADKATTYTKAQVDAKDDLKADKADTYTKAQVDAKDDLKADKADTYTKAEVDGKDALKADQTTVEAIDSEVILARGTEPTLGDRLDGTDAQLADKVQNFKIKNEVVNGDFSQNIPWTNGSNGKNTTSSGFLLLEELSLANGTFCYSPAIQLQENDLVYARASTKGENINSYRLYLRGDITSTITIVEGNPTIEFNTVSGVVKVVGKTGNINVGLSFASGAGAENKKAYLDNICVVNLTSTFGAGNEPTKLEMDELMKIIPNQWWDGELTLNQKQFITWQLNLIRKNTNAIIALGGTIV